MADAVNRPDFIGGPWDGKTLEEKFPPGHVLHGALPGGVRVPTSPPPSDPGPMHIYEFSGGRYCYQGVEDG